ncbi:hypothetical protein ACG7TL_006935 [Trametes sanguinea]
MALFSAQESVYLSSFLSTVDLDSSINNDGQIDPGLADQIPHLQGSEALAKATKDLMALDVPVTSPSSLSSASNSAAAAASASTSTAHPALHPSASSPPSYWPSLPPGDRPGSSSSQHTSKFSQGPGRSSSPAHYLPPRRLSTTIAPSESLRSASQADRSVFQQQHQQIAPLRGFDHASSSSSSAAYALPPISTTGLPNGLTSRPSAIYSASAPSVLSQQQQSSTGSAKRPLPASAEPATDPSSSKRARPSPSSSAFPSAPTPTRADSARSSGAAARRDSSSASGQRSPASASGPSSKAQDKAKARDKAGGSGAGGGGGGGNKGTLLSPSQKRANHIQSEQKRRANIRRGYEALCEAVPALREAIRAEEERERAAANEDADAKGKGRAAGGAAEKGRKKRKAEGEKADGRAGPRSENVVLQKSASFPPPRCCCRCLLPPALLSFLHSRTERGARTMFSLTHRPLHTPHPPHTWPYTDAIPAAIDYITALLSERAALAQRLHIARGVLPLGHPAARPDPRHLDAHGVPLWEREWSGGMDLVDANVGEGEGEEGEGEGSEEEG